MAINTTVLDQDYCVIGAHLLSTGDLAELSVLPQDLQLRLALRSMSQQALRRAWPGLKATNHYLSVKIPREQWHELVWASRRHSQYSHLVDLWAAALPPLASMIFEISNFIMIPRHEETEFRIYQIEFSNVPRARIVASLLALRQEWTKVSEIAQRYYDELHHVPTAADSAIIEDVLSDLVTASTEIALEAEAFRSTLPQSQVPQVSAGILDQATRVLDSLYSVSLLQRQSGSDKCSTFIHIGMEASIVQGEFVNRPVPSVCAYTTLWPVTLALTSPLWRTAITGPIDEIRWYPDDICMVRIGLYWGRFFNHIWEASVCQTA